MTNTKNSARRSRTLIVRYLERVSIEIFSKFPRLLPDLVGRQHGVYSLYKGNRLYYVGLATSLKSRIKHHLKDKHAAKWDKFSLYLVRKEDHIRELESVIMRIASPSGNTARGKLPRAENLRQELMARIKKAQREQLAEVVGPKKQTDRAKSRSTRREVSATRGTPTLAPYIKRGFRIRREYKGVMYTAKVYRSGTINLAGRLYNSPSTASKAVAGRSSDGWIFWRYKNKSGEWVPLNHLRK